MKEEKKLIEAALFMSSRAMSLEEFRTLTGIGALGYIQNVLAELKKDYDERESAVEISESDGKFSMRVRAGLISRVKQFAQDTEISKSALRTLAYLSKHDGMLKSELVRKVGTQAYADVKELVDAGFLKSHKSGRSSKLTLTEKFKVYFVQEKQESASPAEQPPEQTTL
ncbi:SMC-Scp complex subunit ScpB [Candidatus Micrarchaeota archaeon]|nr:SMC-Scp complex subunit ScpB [Candidatus Micrarchaeota archaeon]